MNIRKTIARIVLSIFIALLLSGCTEQPIRVEYNQFWKGITYETDHVVYDDSANSQRYKKQNQNTVCVAIKDYNVFLLEEFDSEIEARLELYHIKNNLAQYDGNIVACKYMGCNGYRFSGNDDNYNQYYQVGNTIIIGLGNSDDADAINQTLLNIINSKNKPVETNLIEPIYNFGKENQYVLR